jgi:peptidylprolyl isomerase
VVGVTVLAAAGLLAVVTVVSVRSSSGVYGIGVTRASASAVDPGTDAATRSKPAAGTLAPAPTALTVTIPIKSNGAPLRAGQVVTTNYVGYSFQTGQELDSSWKRGQSFTFTLGAGQVIPGWDQGLVGAPIGSRIQLDLPADLAFGDRSDALGSGPVRFVIDVISAT